MNPFTTQMTSSGITGFRQSNNRSAEEIPMNPFGTAGGGGFGDDTAGGGSSGGSSGGSGGSGGGGSGGGSSGGSSGGVGDWAQWLQDYYAQFQQGGGGSDYGGDGFFTSGGDLMSILFGEAGAMQQAGDNHFLRVLEREGQLEDFLNSMQGRFENLMLPTQNPEDYASVQRAEQALADFEDRTAQDMSSYNAAMTRQFQNQYQSVMGGMRADGTMMTPQEQADAKFQLQQQIGVSRQQGLTAIMSDYNKHAAAMGMQVAQLTANAEQMNQQANVINLTNQMRVMELELQGRGMLAQLTLNNPETVVSVLGGLMQLNQMGAGFQLMFGSQSAGSDDPNHPWYGTHFDPSVYDGRFGQVGDFNSWEEYFQWLQGQQGG